MTVVLLMGVSGSGKSTIGAELAKRTGWPFLDADTIHPPANVEKMAAGVPLTDADRWPWLDTIGEWIARRLRTGEAGIVACSALRRAYRDRLRRADPDLRVVYLAGDPDLLEGRLEQRRGHFFPASLLGEQLADLEPPGPDEDPLTVRIGGSVAGTTDEVVRGLAG